MKHWSSVRAWLIGVVLVGVTLRLGLAFMLGINIPPPLPSQTDRGSDALEYDTYAWNLVQGHGYRGMSPDVTDPDHLTAYRVPGTALLWGALYRVFGHRYAAVRIANCILGAITILFVYGIGKRCFGGSVGPLSAATFAVWPTSLFYSATLGSEPLFTFLFLWYVLLALQVGAHPAIARAMFAGLLLGLATLTRPNAMFMILLAVFWAWWEFRGQGKNLRIGLAIPLVAVTTLIPWVARNYAVFHELVPLSTGGGDVLLGGNNRVVVTDPVYYGYWVFPTSSLPEYREQLKAPNQELRRDHLETKLALRWLADHPRWWWYLVQAKFRRSLTPILDSNSPRLYRVGMLVFWGPVLVLSALSFFPTLLRFFRSKHPGWILHLAIIDFELTAIIFWGASRFRYPVEGLCIALAYVSMLRLWGKLRGTQQVKETASSMPDGAIVTGTA